MFIDIMTNQHKHHCHYDDDDDDGGDSHHGDDIQPAAVPRLCAWAVQRQVAQLHHRFKSGSLLLSRRMVIIVIIIGDMIFFQMRKLVHTEKVQGN